VAILKIIMETINSIIESMRSITYRTDQAPAPKHSMILTQRHPHLSL
jgi:hypothetical protein